MFTVATNSVYVAAAWTLPKTDPFGSIWPGLAAL